MILNFSQTQLQRETYLKWTSDLEPNQDRAILSQYQDKKSSYSSPQSRIGPRSIKPAKFLSKCSQDCQAADHGDDCFQNHVTYSSTGWAKDSASGKGLK